MPYKQDPRKVANISKNLSNPIDALATQEKRSFVGQVEVMLEFALARWSDPSAETVERVKLQFDHWGREGVKNLVVAGIDYLLSPESQGESGTAIALWAKFINGKSLQPSDISDLAEMLGEDAGKVAQAVGKGKA